MMKHENIVLELERIVAEADRIVAQKSNPIEIEEDPRLVGLMERATQIIEELDPMVRETLRCYPEKMAWWDKLCADYPLDEGEDDE